MMRVAISLLLAVREIFGVGFRSGNHCELLCTKEQSIGRHRFRFKYKLTSHNLGESAQVDGVGQRRRHRHGTTVRRHLWQESGFRSHGVVVGIS